MKLGIISDVHADLPSLIAALELLTKRGADRIICAGDLVERGPDGEAVVQTFKSREIPSVRGNHDLAVIANQRWLREAFYAGDPRVTSRLLTEEALQYLHELPPTMNLVLGDEGSEEQTHLVVAHGIPSSDAVYLYTHSNRRAFNNAINDARDIDPQVRVLILGHTHQPMIAHVGDIYVINPGSVCGVHTQGSSSCGLLTLPEFRFEVFDLVTGMRIVAPMIEPN
ncbi:MAG: metallophosphoesterase family protein [Anaerolineae bacterium]